MSEWTRRKFLQVLGTGAMGGVLWWSWERGAGEHGAGGGRCEVCGGEYVMEHEYAGRRYCPNCGVELGGSPRREDGMGLDAVPFPNPRKVRRTTKPCWAMEELVI